VPRSHPETPPHMLNRVLRWYLRDWFYKHPSPKRTSPSNKSTSNTPAATRVPIAVPYMSFVLASGKAGQQRPRRYTMPKQRNTDVLPSYIHHQVTGLSIDLGFPNNHSRFPSPSESLMVKGVLYELRSIALNPLLIIRKTTGYDHRVAWWPATTVDGNHQYPRRAATGVQSQSSLLTYSLTMLICKEWYDLYK
jgi:hypothetical protein